MALGRILFSHLSDKDVLEVERSTQRMQIETAESCAAKESRKTRIFFSERFLLQCRCSCRREQNPTAVAEERKYCNGNRVLFCMLFEQATTIRIFIGIFANYKS
jgi:hypothetical protein